MKRACLTLAGALMVAVSWQSGSALAGKADDTLNWAYVFPHFPRVAG